MENKLKPVVLLAIMSLGPTMLNGAPLLAIGTSNVQETCCLVAELDPSAEEEKK